MNYKEVAQLTVITIITTMHLVMKEKFIGFLGDPFIADLLLRTSSYYDQNPCSDRFGISCIVQNDIASL